MTDSPSPSSMDLWLEERHKQASALRFRVSGVLFRETSPYQTVEVLETAAFGRMLLNDGLIMLSERDEFIYHDMISHVPLFVHPDPRRVLIIGGGDGGTAREVLRHPGIERCHMVEIDEVVVRACREHIPQTAAALDDPRLDLIIDDGVAFVENTDLRFDVVIVDSTDPIGPAQPLFGPEFYGNVARILRDDGIVVSQAESPHLEAETQLALLKVLSGVFGGVHLYNFTNLTYPGGYWSFSFSSNTLHPLKGFDPKRVEASNLQFQYYNADVHRAAFALPSFLRERVEPIIGPTRG